MSEAEKWQEEWQRGAQESDGKQGLTPCRQVELIGKLADFEGRLVHGTNDGKPVTQADYNRTYIHLHDALTALNQISLLSGPTTAQRARKIAREAVATIFREKAP